MWVIQKFKISSQFTHPKSHNGRSEFVFQSICYKMQQFCYETDAVVGHNNARDLNKFAFMLEILCPLERIKKV